MVLKFFDKVKKLPRSRPNSARRPRRRKCFGGQAIGWTKIGGEFEGMKIFARLLKKRSPAALLGKSRVPQKSFLFLLEEKQIARQIKKCEENFFAEQRAKRAAAGRSELVGILFKMSSDFFQQTPPDRTFTIYYLLSKQGVVGRHC